LLNNLILFDPINEFKLKSETAVLLSWNFDFESDKTEYPPE